MTEIKTVDARGLSCPQPAMLARQAIQKQERGTVEVLVDSGTARENVSRLAKNSGWAVSIEEKTDDSFRIVLKK
ncbi:sulfurtransferase TusA family protein [Chloroflexota bacterium]